MADDRANNSLRGRDLVGLGGLLVGAVVGGMVVGLLVDQAAGTTPLFVLVGLALGVVGGVWGCWVRVRAALRQ
ncbi:MAG TPA: AtpZ/AtpI family protein [Marmoricola sp.]|jgi:F0F1-type ATP synthase assembly protein I